MYRYRIGAQQYTILVKNRVCLPVPKDPKPYIIAPILSLILFNLFVKMHNFIMQIMYMIIMFFMLIM